MYFGDFLHPHKDEINHYFIVRGGLHLLSLLDFNRNKIKIMPLATSECVSVFVTSIRKQAILYHFSGSELSSILFCI